jgi:very-short-patch-repair endonuclease
VTRTQLLAHGLTASAIKQRIARGRLYPVRRGIYAVGRPELTRYGRWMAAVLSCAPDAALSHRSAGALWEITREGAAIDISLPASANSRARDLAVHRRTTLSDTDLTRHRGIPLTTPICTLIDLATCLGRPQLEAAVNEADKRDLVDPEALRAAVAGARQRPGAPALRELLDRHTFVLTDSDLERRFVRIARSAGLPLPETGVYLNGFKIDFYWPDLGLVVETDGLRYHRTPAQQARDRRRDQVHTGAGLTPLRFTHAQVRSAPAEVQATLVAVTQRLAQANSTSSPTDTRPGTSTSQ